MLAGAIRNSVGIAFASVNDAPPSKVTKTGSLAGSVTAATAFAPTPSVISAIAPLLTASRAFAAAVWGEPPLSRTLTVSLRPLPAFTCWAASLAPFSRNSPTHGCAVSGAETTMSAS